MIETDLPVDVDAPKSTQAELPLRPSSDAPKLPNENRRGFYLIRLWQGRVSLASTFWLWGWLATGALTAVARPLYKLAIGREQLTAVPVAIFLWFAFVSVAVWRSANRYKQKRPKRSWGVIAQGLWALCAVPSLWTWLQLIPGVNNTKALAESLTLEQKAIGSTTNGVHSDWTSQNGNTFNYDYTISDEILHKNSGNNMQTLLRSISQEYVCNSPEARRLLVRLDSMHLTYKNSLGATLAIFDIHDRDCDH